MGGQGVIGCLINHPVVRKRPVPSVFMKMTALAHGHRGIWPFTKRWSPVRGRLNGAVCRAVAGSSWGAITPALFSRPARSDPNRANRCDKRRCLCCWHGAGTAPCAFIQAALESHDPAAALAAFAPSHRLSIAAFEELIDLEMPAMSPFAKPSPQSRLPALTGYNPADEGAQMSFAPGYVL